MGHSRADRDHVHTAMRKNAQRVRFVIFHRPVAPTQATPAVIRHAPRAWRKLTGSFKTRELANTTTPQVSAINGNATLKGTCPSTTVQATSSTPQKKIPSQVTGFARAR